MTKYEQAVESINRSFKNKDITKEERDEKLKKAEKFKEPESKTKVITNKTGTKAVNIKTDATGQIMGFYVQIYDGQEQVLESKSFSTPEKAEKWANGKLNEAPEPEESKKTENKSYNVSELSAKRRDLRRKIKTTDNESEKKKLEKQLKESEENDIDLKEEKKQKETYIDPRIEACKETIKEFQEKQKEKKAEKLRETYLQQAITQEDKQKIEQMTTAEILKDANPPVRIDVASKKSLEAVIKRNVLHRYKKLSNEKQSEIKPKIKEIIKDVLDELYPEFDKRLDKYFK